MGISQTTSAIMVFLTGLLPASCHKEEAKKPAPPAITANGTNAAQLPISGNIGQITLTNHADTLVQFANGSSCTLTPKILDKSNLSITVALEAHNDYGDTKNFAVTQISGQQGKSLEVSVGGMSITLIPTVVPDK